MKAVLRALAWFTLLPGIVATAAPADSVDPRESLDSQALTTTISSVLAASSDGRPVEWTQVAKSLLAFAEKYPASATPAGMMRNAMYSFEMSHPPAESAAMWRAFVDSANQPLAEMAREKVRAFEAISTPVELAFTALDGREVDLRKLRGKVVLIDFWAIWCGPCMAEMPNVKRIYQACHDKGFEIVGIDCDVAPGENAPAAAYIKSGPQVLEFCRKNEMPWPEHYEGRKHNEGGNSLARRFAVTGIPGSFLLDRSGNVVALNLRGEMLEKEVKRLLKL